MNKQQKEQYLRDYGTLKAQGKPFFPYAVAKDSAMAVVVMIVIITMSILLGAELGPKADPTSTTYTPRPEWYFFFLFELLRVIKPPALVPLATIGVPTICLILLFLLPFYDRGLNVGRSAGRLRQPPESSSSLPSGTSPTSEPLPARRRRSTSRYQQTFVRKALQR